MVLNSYGGQQPVMPLNMAGQVLILIKDTPPVLWRDLKWISCWRPSSTKRIYAWGPIHDSIRKLVARSQWHMHSNRFRGQAVEYRWMVLLNVNLEKGYRVAVKRIIFSLDAYTRCPIEAEPPQKFDQHNTLSWSLEEWKSNELDSMIVRSAVIPLFELWLGRGKCYIFKFQIPSTNLSVCE